MISLIALITFLGCGNYEDVERIRFNKLLNDIEQLSIPYEIERSTQQISFQPAKISVKEAKKLNYSLGNQYLKLTSVLDSCLVQSVIVNTPRVASPIFFTERTFENEMEVQTYLEAEKLLSKGQLSAAKLEKESYKGALFGFLNRVYFFETTHNKQFDCHRQLILEVKKIVGCKELGYTRREFE